jgi:4-hydroxybenzoate polyprenyltransferase
MSIDVALGAVVCALFFAQRSQITFYAPGLISLGLTVWIIYTADHLMDVFSLNKMSATPRRRYHQRNFGILCILLVMALVMDIFMTLFIRRQIIIGGLLLAFIVVLYLWGQRRISPLKEFVGALLYSGGVLLPVLSLQLANVTSAKWIAFMVFFLTALINLVLFSWFDLEHDRKDRQTSLVTLFGWERTGMILKILFLVQGILLTVLSMKTSDLPEVLVLATMNSILCALFILRKHVAKNGIYRLAGDAIFLLPLAFLNWNG